MEKHFDKEEELRLISLCKEGNEEAFIPFIEKYKTRIFYLCYKIVKDRDIAQDMSQEAFVHAFQHIKEFREEARFYTWLYRIAYNLTINYLRKKIRIPENEFKENMLTFQQSQKALRRLTRFLPFELIDSEEVKNHLQEAIFQLSAKHQEVFILYVLRQIPQKKIAEILKINSGTVRSRLYYARKSLMNFYKNMKT